MLLALLGLTLTATAPVRAQSIFTVAGGGVADGRPATIVGLSASGVAVDHEGNLYIADASDHRVRVVDTETGIISTFAGNGSEGFGGDGGPAAEASLNSPGGLAIDTAGNVYIADTFNLRIRRVDATTGMIETIAGTGTRGFAGDGGPATEATFDSPISVALDDEGNVFVGDFNNHRVRRIDPAGIVTTIAGNGQSGFSGDGGPATLASFAGNPSKPALSIAVDLSGNLYVGDSANHRVRRVDAATGTITTIAGTGAEGFAGDGGAATLAQLDRPDGVSVDTAGNLFVADSDNLRIRRISSSSGLITTVAGSGLWGFAGDGGPATEARFKIPDVVLAAPDGDLFIGDRLDHRVRRVDGLSGDIATVAGNGSRTFTGDGGLSTEAQLARPGGVAIRDDGSILIADAANQRVRHVDSDSRIITTFSGSGEYGSAGDGGPATAATHSWPGGVAVDTDDNVYVCDRFAQTIRRIDSQTGIITTIAGIGERGFSGDGGPATLATFEGPNNIAVSLDGHLYVADSGNHRIRRVDLGTGLIDTVAGNGTSGFAGDGGPATMAALGGPGGVAVDATGNLFIADSDNSRIRRVDAATGTIQTVAGGGSSGADGGPATDVSLLYPEGVAIGPDGHLYIADTYHDSVRVVDEVNGTITTLAGSGTRGFLGDAGPATGAAMTVPESLTLDHEGNLYIADTNNNRVRVVYRCLEIDAIELTTPSNGSSGLSSSPVLGWVRPAGAFRFDVYLDISNPPQRLIASDIETTTFAPGDLQPLTTYYWKVVAKGDPFCDPFRSVESEVRSFTTTSSCDVPVATTISKRSR
jgi:sugar lactone lactonase YvrE